MFDKLEDLARRLEEINMLLTEPDIINNQDKYKELMREQSELAPIVSKYKEYDEITSNELQDYMNSQTHLSNSSINKIYQQFNQTFKIAINNLNL